MHRIDPVGPRENPAVTGVRPVGERREPPPDPRDQQRRPRPKQPPAQEQGEQSPPEDGEVRHIDVQA